MADKERKKGRLFGRAMDAEQRAITQQTGVPYHEGRSLPLKEKFVENIAKEAAKQTDGEKKKD